VGVARDCGIADTPGPELPGTNGRSIRGRTVITDDSHGGGTQGTNTRSDAAAGLGRPEFAVRPRLGGIQSLAFDRVRRVPSLSDACQITG
jgi:hypothetical protein